MTFQTCVVAILLATLATVPELAATEPPSQEEVAVPESKQAESLLLEDLERMALEQNPTLVQAALHIRISRGEAIQAGLYPNPIVGYLSATNGNKGRHCDVCNAASQLRNTTSEAEELE